MSKTFNAKHFFSAVLVVCIAVSTVCQAQSRKLRKYKRTVFDCDVQLNRDFEKLNDSVFVMKSEVTNCRYKAFLTYLQKNEQVEMLRVCTPDSNFTSVPHTTDASMQVMSKFYFKHAAYNYYPVCNVSYRAALAYCAYLTEMLNAQGNGTYVVRLPTYGEYYEYSDLGELRKREKNYRSLFTAENSAYYFQEVLGEAATPTMYAITSSYKPSSHGIYNCFGNVAEMLSDMEFAVGGSCFDKPNEMPDDMLYTKAIGTSPLVGFRVVVVKR
ncbi:MAG: hypothetical protein RL660_206 [Bacteroidota bacterium]|jgi:formylglycine-generating enzyme required for sulfatase activity